MLPSRTDFLIVGAGFAGLTLAERLCSAGFHCTLVDRRSHIGGNSHDEYDAHGVLIHSYGPHYFRTNSPQILEYLGRFTQWRPHVYKVQSWTDGRYWSFPVNLKTFEQLVGHRASEEEFAAWLEAERIPIDMPRNSEEVILSQMGRRLYELFFRGYTRKQWKLDPSELDASVCGRIPIRTDRNDAYLKEQFQCLPAEGYHVLFDNMKAACGERLSLVLGVDYRDLKDSVPHRHLFFTGAIDEFYKYRFGPLPYRSLRFEREYFSAGQLRERLPVSGKAGFWQPELQVNYPNDFEFTRIVEMKHATGQVCAGSTIVREYPADWELGQDPYYPVPSRESRALYERYRALADGEKDVTFLGRLGTYKYYNMDQVVAQALKVAEDTLAAHQPLI
ncbi:MAG: NAD(P)-binding protein [Opitutales bacterium]|nr:NAD(P)-binding protein [Opitutales bacterium]